MTRHFRTVALAFSFASFTVGIMSTARVRGHSTFPNSTSASFGPAGAGTRAGVGHLASTCVPTLDEKRTVDDEVDDEGPMVRNMTRVATAASAASRRAVMVRLGLIDQRAVRRALDLADDKLALPGCPQIYADFSLENGETPQDELDKMGIGPAQFLETLVFTDGSRESGCRTGPAVLRTTPGSGLIFVCPGFATLVTADPAMSASLIIHESLHALGLLEDAWTSKEITRRVERRCWKLGKGSSTSPPFDFPRDTRRGNRCCVNDIAGYPLVGTGVSSGD